MRKIWRLWARALGEKIGPTGEADTIAIFRTLIIIQAVVCNAMIVANIIKNW
jgi:hypothetical protein